MKVSELLQEKKEPEEQKGTYAAVEFAEQTLKAIAKFIKENKIPNPLDTSKLHCTLLYSRKYCPDYKPAGQINPAWIGEPKGFDVWKTKPKDGGEGSNCLVLEFDCDKLNERHEELMKEHDATYDFPDYKTHISFSYDIGDFDWKELPEFKDNIVIVKEYGEDLDLDFAKKNSKKDEKKKDDK